MYKNWRIEKKNQHEATEDDIFAKNRKQKKWKTKITNHTPSHSDASLGTSPSSSTSPVKNANRNKKAQKNRIRIRTNPRSRSKPRPINTSTRTTTRLATFCRSLGNDDEQARARRSGASSEKNRAKPPGNAARDGAAEFRREAEEISRRERFSVDGKRFSGEEKQKLEGENSRRGKRRERERERNKRL